MPRRSCPVAAMRAEKPRLPRPNWAMAVNTSSTSRADSWPLRICSRRNTVAE